MRASEVTIVTSDLTTIYVLKRYYLQSDATLKIIILVFDMSSIAPGVFVS